MPNFFEDVGRSGAAESLMQVPKLAIELSKLNTEASNQRFKAAIDLKRMGMEEEELAMKKVTQTAQLEQTAQQTRKAKFEADELQKKTEYLSRWSKPELNPVVAGLPEESRKLLLDGWKASGAMNEKGEVQTRTMLDSYHELSTDPSKFEAVLAGPLIKQAEAQVSAAYDELQKELAKGPKANPDKVAEYEANHKIAYKNYMEKTGQIGKASEEVIKNQQRLEEAKLKKDEFESWKSAIVKETGREPTSAEILNWKKSTTKTPLEGTAKVGTIGQVNRELAGRFLPVAKENVKGNSEAAKILEGINISLGSTDQFGGTVNDARLYDALNEDQRKQYKTIKEKAQQYAGMGLNPAEAVSRAESEWNAANPPKKATKESGAYKEFLDAYNQIANYKGWGNEEKNKRIGELNARARKGGVIK